MIVVEGARFRQTRNAERWMVGPERFASSGGRGKREIGGPPGKFVDLSFDGGYGRVRLQVCQTKGVSGGVEASVTRLLPSGRMCGMSGASKESGCEMDWLRAVASGWAPCSGVEIVKERRVEERDPNGWSRQPSTESYILPYNYHDVKGIPERRDIGFVPGLLPNGYNLALELVGVLGSMDLAAVAKWSNSNGIRRATSLGTLSTSCEI